MIQDHKVIVIVTKRRAAVVSNDDAYAILDCFANQSGATFNARYGSRNTSEACVVAYLAARRLAQSYVESADSGAFAALGVTPATTDGPIEPTWTSRDGTTRRIREMPTAHLVNILNKYVGGDADGLGVLDAISDELRSRKASA